MRLWDVGSGRCLRTFEGHSEGVRAVCLSADDRFALTDSEDKTMKLWNVGSGRCLRTFEGHSKAIHSISLSGDCRYALWGGADFLKLWQVSSGRCVRTFKKSRGAISSASLSADGRLVLSGDSNALKVWDVGTGRCLQTFEGHSQPVKSVSLSGDGRYALSGSEDRTLKLWEVKSGRCLRTLAHDRQVGFVAWASDSQYAFAVSNNEILAWFLDWEMDENAHADWDEGARPHLDVFLRAHQPYAGSLPKDRQPTDEEVTRALTRQGGPEWTEEDFQKFLYTLGCAGYGWLRPEGVRRELVRMAAAWKDPE